MKNIILSLFVVLFALSAFAQPPDATTLVDLYGQAGGVNWWAQPWNKENIVADSTAIVDDTTIYSNPIWIAPFGGVGVIQMYVNAPDTDSVAVQWSYEVGNNTGADKYWTSIESSDTLFAENTFTTFFIDLDTLGAWSYLRIAIKPECTADTSFICDDNIDVYGYCRFNLRSQFSIPYDSKGIKNMMDDGYSFKYNGAELK